MNQQALVNGYFESSAPFWRDIYEQTDVISRIYQTRFRTVLEILDSLPLPAGSRILEAGCGAGHTTLALAQRGFDVDALDAAQAMADETRDRLHTAGFSGTVRSGIGNIYRLPHPNGKFALALAIGVLPWLEDRERAIRELARVVSPGGYVLVTADNSRSLSRTFDPSLNPIVQPVKRALAGALSRAGLRRSTAQATFCSNAEIDRMLARQGLRKLRSATVGFGPFTFFNRSLLRGSTGERLHERLQEMAFHPSSWIRGAGSHYLVLAQK